MTGSAPTDDPREGLVCVARSGKSGSGSESLQGEVFAETVSRTWWVREGVPGPSDHLQHHEQGSVPSPTWKDKAQKLGSEIRFWVSGQNLQPPLRSHGSCLQVIVF